MAFSRREFLWITGGGAAATLAACSKGKPAPAPRATASGAPAATSAAKESDAFLRQLREAVRTSADHLSARADAIVASRDPLKAVRFVRDEIAVLPSDFPTTSANWGPRATLRAGAGTLRERAEVLAGMLTAMGVSARIREIDRPSGLTAAALWRARPHAFEPDPAKLKPLFDQAGITAPPPASFGVDREAQRAITEMADALLGRMPAASRRASRVAKRDLPDRIPVVEYSAEGRRVIAVAAGDLDVLGAGAGEPRDPGAMQLPTVEVAVSVALNPPVGSTLDPSQIQELLRASWPADQLAGRRLTLTFPVPGQGLRQPPGPEESPTRVPLLRLSDARPIPDSVQTMVAGSLVSLSGGVFRPDPSDPNTIRGPFGPLTLAPRRDDLARSASAVAAAVSAATFPDIDLRVSVRDAGNKPVNGLAASDFVVTEDGRPQSAFVLADTAPALPRVLVVYDGSMSATSLFHTPQGKLAFDRRLATALVNVAATTPFTTQVITIGGAATEAAWVAPETDRLVGAMQVNSTSDLWQTLGEAVPASGASTVVLVSDNDATDDPRVVPALRARLKASGIPLICVPVGAPGSEHTAAIVAATGGVVVNPADPDLTRILASALRARVAAPPYNYRMRYRSDRPAPDGKTRAVAVALAAKRTVAAEATYTVPAAEDRLVPSGLAGIYVTISVNGVAETRRLGGVDVSYRGTPDRGQLDARAIAEAANVAYGITTIAFEPPNPSAGEMLDDTITALIGVEPALDAIPQGEAALTAQAPHIQRVPAMFAALFEQVGDGNGDAVATSLRTAILIETRDLPAGAQKPAVIDVLDVVPAHNRVLGVGDPAAAFRAAMTASLTASYREMALSPESAASRLKGKPLTWLAPFARYNEPAKADASVSARRRTLLERYADMHRFVVADGSAAEMWIVDPASGSAIAIDGAGRGGARMVAGGGSPRCDPADFQLVALLDFAALLVASLCTAAEHVKSVGAQLACIGANVEGVGALVYGSWKHPAGEWMSVPVLGATVVGAAMGLKDAVQGIGHLASGKTPSPTAVAKRAVLVVIGIMLYGISSATDCHPDPVPRPDPTLKPGPTCAPGEVSCNDPGVSR